jgi:hypothetical protein
MPVLSFLTALFDVLGARKRHDLQPDEACLRPPFQEGEAGSISPGPSMGVDFVQFGGPLEISSPSIT